MWLIPTLLLLQASCPVDVGAVLEARASRGRITPMLEDVFDKHPHAYRRWHGRSHGDRYWVCKYEVKVRGVGYTHEHWVHDLYRKHDEGVCEEPGTRAATRRRIIEFTNWCRDVHAGEYYGDVLEPLP